MRSIPVEDSAFPAPRLLHDASLASLLVQIVFVAYFILSRTDDWLICNCVQLYFQGLDRKRKTLTLFSFMVAKAYLIFFGNQLISFFYRRKCEKGT